MYSPAAVAVGVPFRRPVALLKDAQVGLFAMLKESVLSSGSEALGVNE